MERRAGSRVLSCLGASLPFFGFETARLATRVNLKNAFYPDMGPFNITTCVAATEVLHKYSKDPEKGVLNLLYSSLRVRFA